MRSHHIFLLTPSDPNDQNHRAVLIWSDNEQSARRNAYSVSNDTRKGTLSNEVTLEELSFYQDTEKVICREFEENTDYTLVSSSDTELIIEYQNKRYTLVKDESQIE